MIMGIVRLQEGKSTGHRVAKALSDKEIVEPAAHDIPLRHKNARWIDTLKSGPAHKGEHIPGRRKHPAVN